MSNPWRERVEIAGGRAVLYLGDARALGVVLNGCVAILTDPPFGIGYRSGYATTDLWQSDRIEGDVDTETRDLVLASLPPVPALVFGSWKVPAPAGARARLIWDKGPALGMGALDIPWKPSTEDIYVLGRGFVGARDEGAVIYCPPVQSMACNGRLHPNEKPVRLLQRLMRKLPPGPVGDPFMGSGSCGEAALQAGRQFIGIEIDDGYFRTACRRIAEAARQPDLLIPETSA